MQESIKEEYKGKKYLHNEIAQIILDDHLSIF